MRREIMNNENKIRIFIIIIISALMCGCSIFTPQTMNNSSPLPLSTPVTSEIEPLTVLPASGQVFMDGNIIKNAVVEANSIDGIDHLSTITDNNGTYILYLKPSVPYKITARYMGIQHTIWPIIVQEDNIFWYTDRIKQTNIGLKKNENDIVLTYLPRSEIAGFVSPHHLSIEATPLNGGPTLSTTNDLNNTYSIEVEPDTEYRLSVKDVYEQFKAFGMIHPRYIKNPDYFTNNVTLNPIKSNETLLVDIRVNLYK